MITRSKKYAMTVSQIRHFLDKCTFGEAIYINIISSSNMIIKYVSNSVNSLFYAREGDKKCHMVLIRKIKAVRYLTAAEKLAYYKRSLKR